MKYTCVYFISIILKKMSIIILKLSNLKFQWKLVRLNICNKTIFYYKWFRRGRIIRSPFILFILDHLNDELNVWSKNSYFWTLKVKYCIIIIIWTNTKSMIRIMKRYISLNELFTLHIIKYVDVFDCKIWSRNILKEYL